MNPPRERSTIVASWLEEGPTELPESTRRAIAVDIRATRQSRRAIWAPWRFPTLDRTSLLAMAVLVSALVGLTAFVVGPPGAGNVGGAPSAAPVSPSPSTAPSGATNLPIPAMRQAYVSVLHGYTISYPADWSSTAATQLFSPPAWKVASSPLEPFDVIAQGDKPPFLRAASAAIPAGLPNTNDWIDEFLTHSTIAACAPPRERWEPIRIDGAPGRLLDSCGQVEATVVLDGRVYMFTLFLGDDQFTNGRELFVAFAATIDLRPEDAVLPSPSP